MIKMVQLEDIRKNLIHARSECQKNRTQE